MNTSAGGFRVAVVGASSLLGKELLAVLEERKFPISRLVTPGSFDDSDPDLPVLDLGGGLEAAVAETDVGESDLDIVFLAAPIRLSAGKGTVEGTENVSFLQSTRRLAAATRCKVIDLCGCLAEESGWSLSVPILGRHSVSAATACDSARPPFLISARSATIMIAAIILRLAERLPIKNIVVQVFQPVSEIGTQAIDELQKQTLNLLSFQKIPQTVFGAQLAFNLLPRLGRPRGTNPKGSEGQLLSELAELLGPKTPMPALRILYAPVFHSLGCSLLVEFDLPPALDAVTQALAGEPIRIRKTSEGPPTQVEVAGSSDILLDALTLDGSHPGGVWIWAVADNLRLAAVNAVEIAENLDEKTGAQNQVGRLAPKVSRSRT